MDSLQYEANNSDFPVLILYEDSLNGIHIPFERVEMLPVLKEKIKTLLGKQRNRAAERS
jgi:hypothetical protein